MEVQKKESAASDVPVFEEQKPAADDGADVPQAPEQK
jgi:hypothetical protein